MDGREFNLKKQWDLKEEEIPKERSQRIDLRSERWENVIQDRIIKKASVLALVPNVFNEFKYPWFRLKLHFRPFNLVNKLMFSPNQTDLELLSIFYDKKIGLRPCLSSLGDFFPEKDVPDYLKEAKCPLCESDTPFSRYFLYGGALSKGTSWDLDRRLLVSFRSDDLAEIINSGGILKEKEGVFTLLGLKPVLEELKKYSGDVLRIFDFKSDFYIITLRFDSMGDLVWSEFSPVFSKIVDSYFAWEPLVVLINLDLLGFLQNKEKFGRLCSFYKQVSEIYSRVRKIS